MTNKFNSSSKPPFRHNRKGMLVVNDGRSNVSNPDGRPPKMREQYLIFISTHLREREFTSQEIIEAMPKHIKPAYEMTTDMNVRAGMMLRNLEKRGHIQCVGLKPTSSRGNNLKLYKFITI